MYTAKIIEIKEDLMPNGKSFLDVELGIFKGKKQVDVRKYAFDVETPEKEIKSQMGKVIALYNVEAENAILDAKKQAIKKKVNKTINKLKGESI